MIDESRRKFLTVVTSIVGGIGVLATSIPFIKTMLPSERSKVMGAAVKVDISSIEMGDQISIKWRGKPIWVLRRTPQMLENLKNLEAQLRDPSSEVRSQQPAYVQNSARSINPEYFICIGLCTHLGCVPKFHPEPGPTDHDKNWYGGYFCPCHGSRFDLAGRVYKGVPAPTNLLIPPHHYEDSNTIIIGEDQI